MPTKELPEVVANEEAFLLMSCVRRKMRQSNEPLAHAQDLKDQDVWDLNRAKELWKLGGQ